MCIDATVVLFNKKMILLIIFMSKQMKHMTGVLAEQWQLVAMDNS